MLPTVLVVDDSEDDLLLLRLAFEKASTNCKLLTVRRGEMAVDYLLGNEPYSDREKFPIPSVVLLDIQMPGITGFNVLAWLRSRPEFSALPVVMLTSSSLESDINTAALLGANDYRIKPNDYNELVAIIQDVCARWTGAVDPTGTMLELPVNGPKVDAAVPLGQSTSENHSLEKVQH